jgi:hypothetical protein
LLASSVVTCALLTPARLEPAPADCPITSPNLQGRLFPGAEANHGNAGLSTWAWSPVTFKRDGPGCVAPDGSLLIKWGWWRGVRGQIEVTGHRLDGSPGAVRAYYQPRGDIGFQNMVLIFPSAGCWEVTGEVADATLSFMVLVVKVGEGPATRCEQLYPGALAMLRGDATRR